MTAKVLDATTLRSPEKSRGRRSEDDCLGLTVAWHPDVSRVGDWQELPAHARVSRLEPELISLDPGVSTSPLAEPNLSRRPLELVSDESGDVEVRVPEGGSVVRIQDQPTKGARVLSRRDVRDGVVITLADRVALVIRRSKPPARAGARHGLVGAGEALQWMVAEAERVAAADVPVLIRGATGTGKELVARAVHAASPRSAGAYVAVNMTTLAAATAASQLFGHQKGAFTGADADHVGFFGAADGGTLFLDEIGETPSEVQAMLLRTLETGEVMRLGATAPTAVDVRVIAATDADLELAVASDRFRSPLLHRLAGYQISVAPLSARREDVGRLLLHFLRVELERASGDNPLAGREPTEPTWLGARQVARLCAQPWPGNVRQLRNVARRLAIACADAHQVGDADIDRALAAGGALAVIEEPAPARRRKPRSQDISDEELIAALRANAFKTGATATALGISRTSLYARIDRSAVVRKARDLEPDEIEGALRRAGGVIADAAASLEVSERGLQLRLKELGLSSG